MSQSIYSDETIKSLDKPLDNIIYKVKQLVNNKIDTVYVFYGKKEKGELDDNLIKNILFWQNRKILYIDSDNSVIKIEKNNKIRGDIVIRSFGKNLNYQNKNFLNQNGFKQNNEEWFLKLKIHGTRYLADENIKGYLPQLDLNYKIKIVQPLSLKSKFIAITLSPITLGIDGVMTIGKILLFPFRD